MMRLLTGSGWISPLVAIRLAVVAACLALASGSLAQTADISQFVGSYEGEAQVEVNGQIQERDLSVDISETRSGFQVNWTTITYRSDGRVKEAKYSINFVPSDRDNVFAAAMKKNVFGHEVQLDPMKGEPYVWARIIGDTMTVFSLFVTDQGDYEIQEFNRTIAEQGLELDFVSTTNGQVKRQISTLLERQ
ncbi:MAG: hypothetical protein AAGF79_09250 [Pseudomonadota bacterium]